MEWLMLVTILFGVSIDFSSAKLSISETLVIKTFCDLNSVSIDCGTNNIIALQQVQYGYATRCSTVCCQSKESGDCVIPVTDTRDFKRACSGHSTCNPPVVSSHDFCSFNRQTASYVYIEYYCIPNLRKMSVCSSSMTTITSSGEPLYLTNPGYPGATIGTRSCSCSFEAESCSTGTSTFIIDADLYSEPLNCNQSLGIISDNNTILESVECGNYYNTFLTEKQLPSNYFQIVFESNSIQNLEGYMFIGFIASNSGVPFSIACSNKSATWCIDCGIPDNITNGIVLLNNPGTFGYNATATVTCNPGFLANTTIIVCKEQGIWESVSCSPKDCGIPTSITNGVIKLDVATQTVYNSSATVTCNTGFNASTIRIVCTENGTWESAACVPKDCGIPTNMTNGFVSLDVPAQTVYNSTATVTCNTGFNATATKIKCVENGNWENAPCTPKECGPVVNISFGVIRLTDNNNVSYGAEALVECEDGFVADKLVIRCLASGKWEAGYCTAPELTKAPSTTPVNNNNINKTIIIVVLVSVFGGAFVIQLIVATFLHIKIYSKYTSDTGKVVCYISLSAIPYIGIYFIRRFYKWGGYKKYHMEEAQYSQNINVTSRSFTNDHNGNGHTTFHNAGYDAVNVSENSKISTKSDSNGTTENVEVEDKRDDQASYDNATHHEDIILDHNEHHPDSKTTNHQTMTRGTSAVLSSSTHLTDVGKPYEHLHPQRKDSNHYTKLHSDNLHEISHDHGNHILEERRKSRSGHVEFH